MVFDHIDGFLDEAHLHHRLARFDEHLDAVAVACRQPVPDIQRVFRAGHVQVVGRQAGEPCHHIGLPRHQPFVFGHHVIGPSGGLVELDEATAGVHVDAGGVGCLVERDGLVVVLGLDEDVHPGLDKHRVRFAVDPRLPGEMGEQLVEGIVLAIRLGEQCQRIQGVGADLRRLEGGPGRFLGQVKIAGIDGPLGDAGVLPKRISGPLAWIIESQCLVGMAEERQGDGRPVAECRVALLGKCHQCVDVAVAGLGHGETDPYEFLLRRIIGGIGGLPVPLGRLERVARCVEETGLEQQAVWRLPERQCVINGTQCLLLTAMAPVDVGDCQVVIGTLLRRSVPIVGKHANAPRSEFDAVVLEDGLVVQRIDFLQVDADGCRIRLHDFGERAGGLRAVRKQANGQPDRRHVPGHASTEQTSPGSASRSGRLFRGRWLRGTHNRTSRGQRR